MVNTAIEISVLIPVYNVERYIEKCLRSLFEQTIANKAEFILCNDCTPDNSISIAQKTAAGYPHLKDRIHFISHEKNQGLSSARNSLIKAAKGKYIIFADSDDWTEHDYLELLYNKAEKEQADVTGCGIVLESQNGQSCTIKNKLPEDPYECISQQLKGQISPSMCLKLIRLDILKNNNIVWIPEVSVDEDVLASIKIFSCAAKITSVDKALYHYNLSPPVQ